MTNAEHSRPHSDMANTLVLRDLPSIPSLLGRAAFKNNSYTPGDSLPALSVEVRGQKIDPDHLRSYNELCNFPVTERVPPTYLHLLTFPLMLKIGTSPEFPLKAMGQIHLRNSLELHQSVPVGVPLTLRAAIGHHQLVSSGLEWDMNLSAWAGDQLLWSGISTHLYRCKTGIRRTRSAEVRAEGEQASWDIRADTGRRYAWVSRDYNPIHMADITARMFGFRHAIAHGMWCKARCLAALDGQLPTHGYAVDVDFYRPVFLPSSVSFYQRRDAEGIRFSLFNQKGRQAHLNGRVRTLKDQSVPAAETSG